MPSIQKEIEQKDSVTSEQVDDEGHCRHDEQVQDLLADDGEDLEWMFETFVAFEEADVDRVMAALAKKRTTIACKCPPGDCIRYSENVGFSAADVEQDVAAKLIGFVRRGGLVVDADSFARTSVGGVVGGDWRRINERRGRVTMIQGGGFIGEICAEDDDSLTAYERTEDVGDE